MKLTTLNQSYPNKTAFITGAGSGLGAAFASLLAENGWTLYLADINLSSLKAMQERLSDAKQIHLYELDVSDKESYEKVAGDVIHTTGEIDLLINNAGIGDGEFFENYQAEHWERMIRINLLGVFYGCHYFVPQMIRKKHGMIINIGSAAGIMNSPGMSAYNTSKAAVYSLSETLFHELKPKNIRVSVATPTFFRTNIMSQAAGSKPFIDFAEKQMKYSKTSPEETAQVILEKASEGVFQIVHPADARRNLFLKKWFPKLINKHFDKLMEKFGNS